MFLHCHFIFLIFLHAESKSHSVLQLHACESEDKWHFLHSKCKEADNIKSQSSLVAFMLTFQMVVFSLLIKTSQHDESSPLSCKQINKLLFILLHVWLQLLKPCLRLPVHIISLRLLGLVVWKHTFQFPQVVINYTFVLFLPMLVYLTVNGDGDWLWSQWKIITHVLFFFTFMA